MLSSPKTNFLIGVLFLCFVGSTSYASDNETKRREMLHTSVYVGTETEDGSGTVISKTDTGMDGVFRYSVLTNEHVTRGRFVRNPESPTERIDKGCSVWTFDHINGTYQEYPASIIAENEEVDIALLAFSSSDVISVAIFATQEMLNRIGVFDEVFAIGCNLKDDFPGPTIGIISLVHTERMGKIDVVIYSNTAQIVPGASGGGLFKEYDGHYYLVGIPFRLGVIEGGHMVPHLAEAISLSAVKNLIHESAVILP